MAKLLVNNHQGRQEIIEVSESGIYLDPSRVLWDDRTDGQLPDNILLGAMKRDGSSLVIDETLRQQALTQAVQDAYEEALSEIIAKRVAEYPSFGDWDDARWKADYLGDRTELDRLNKLKADIKAKYPKPQAPS